jgi:PIN domain nuclease of toxin-antitoxin system
MHKLYLDTGALVRLYIIEQGSEFVQKTAQSANILPIQTLQITELRNALHAAPLIFFT